MDEGDVVYTDARAVGFDVLGEGVRGFDGPGEVVLDGRGEGACKVVADREGASVVE